MDSNTIKQKRAEYMRQYFLDNKEQIHAYQKKYREKNREKSLLYKSQNKEKLYKQNKLYYERNKEHRDKLNKEYRIKNKEKLTQKFNCMCGGRYTYETRSIHFNTKKHKFFVFNTEE
tara:strand:+ start:795 stop:1145 length:351 start_codon:yes stop_codon:yes gene_type:complete